MGQVEGPHGVFGGRKNGDLQKPFQVVPLYCLGRRLEGLHPYVPVLHGIPIAVAVLTYDGHLSFGLTADGAVEDLAVLAGGLQEALGELEKATSVDGVIERDA